ncbi:ROK family protein [Nocardia salmonicida]|uniref:ROK family protein n=1 Tax=Nocardia salmonicida TaxID=53431 RepID=UPI002E2CEFF3|nr:ROK family protein [Nocardia salmonicida]
MGGDSAPAQWNPLITLADIGKADNAAKDRPVWVGAGILGTVLARVAARPDAMTRATIAAGSSESVRPIDRPLAMGTVSKAVGLLQFHGLLATSERKLQRGNHWVEQLHLDPRFVTAAVHVILEHDKPKGVRIVLCDIGGRSIHAEHREVFPVPERDWQILAPTIHARVGEMRRGLRDPETEVAPQLFGVAVEVGAPVIDGKITPLRWIVHGDVEPIDLDGQLRELFAADGGDELLPAILVENDATCLTALIWKDLGYTVTDLAVAVVLDNGIGGGLVMDGRLRRGRSGRAMEIGHLVVAHQPEPRTETAGGLDRDEGVAVDDPVCACGLTGHTEVYATIASVRRDLRAGKTETLEQAARRMEPEHARRVLTRSGAFLGQALAHVCNVVDPGLLVLYLPRELADTNPARRTSHYIRHTKKELEQAFAVRGRPHTEFLAQSLPDQTASLELLFARAAVVCLLDGVVEQALDYVPVVDERSSVAKAGGM